MNVGDEEKLKKQLADERFGNIFVWRDAPDTFYPEHEHAKETAHIILEGEMTLTVSGKTHELKTGDRFHVPAKTRHIAQMGKKGCKYIVAER